MLLIDAASRRAARGRDTLRTALRRWLVTGAVVLVPIVVTLLVLGLALNFISGLLNPLVELVRTAPGIPANTRALLIQGVTVVGLLGLMLVVGFLAEKLPSGGRASNVLDEAIESIPAVGSVYTGFRRMSEVMVESDAESFRDVKLVEYPTEGSYTLAFVTAETPTTVTDAVGDGDMVTLFMPMAPNPVMGGFVLHVERERVIDVDLSVEQGVQAIMTSGVTVGDDGGRQRDLDPDELQSLGADATAPTTAATEGGVEDVPADRREAYADDVEPEQAKTPAHIAARERPGEVHGEAMDGRPVEAADRPAEHRDDTEERPAEAADRPAEQRDETDTRPAAVEEPDDLGN